MLYIKIMDINNFEFHFIWALPEMYSIAYCAKMFNLPISHLFGYDFLFSTAQSKQIILNLIFFTDAIFTMIVAREHSDNTTNF